MNTPDVLYPIGSTSDGEPTYFTNDPEIYGETKSSGEFFVGDVVLVDNRVTSRYEPIMVGEVVGFEVVKHDTVDQVIRVCSFVHLRGGETIPVGSNVEILSRGPSEKTWTQDELQGILKWGSTDI
jgi:hypothetical protein